MMTPRLQKVVTFACIYSATLGILTTQSASAFPLFGSKGIFHRKSNESDPKTFQTQASWYGGKFHGRPTASGEIYDQNSLTAASPDLPFGTKVLVKNPANGKTVTVVINDRGPFVAGRGIDLSRAAAQQLGITGVSPVICYADSSAPGGFRTVQAQRTKSGGYRLVFSHAFKKVFAKIKKFLLD